MSEFTLTTTQKESLMRKALAEAARGVAEGEAPIGCVVARPLGNEVKIVARGHNRMNAQQNKIAHAEIVAFFDAAHKQGEPLALPLNCRDAILVSTLEPCVMCLGAAMGAGVCTVLFGLQAPADNGTQRVKPPESPENSAPTIEGGIMAAESRQMFAEWLRGKEGTEQAQFVEQLLALTADKSL